MSKLIKPLIDFGLAWRLLTVVPLPLIPEDFERPAGYSAGYYPLVGLILGLILAGGAYLFDLWLSPGLSAALLLTLWVGLTGLLHLDGFMDSCDGLLPPRDAARRLEIMKDSRVGAFGVVGAILLLFIKYNTLLVLPAAQQTFILLTVPTLARWAMVWQMMRYPLARPEGTSNFFQAGLGWPQVIFASFVVLIVLGTAWLWWGVLWLGITWLVTTAMACFAMARINGLTGDVYGATCVIVEVVLLVVMVSV